MIHKRFTRFLLALSVLLSGQAVSEMFLCTKENSISIFFNDIQNIIIKEKFTVRVDRVTSDKNYFVEGLGVDFLLKGEKQNWSFTPLSSPRLSPTLKDCKLNNGNLFCVPEEFSIDNQLTQGFYFEKVGNRFLLISGYFRIDDDKTTNIMDVDTIRGTCKKMSDK